ncbi:protein YIPF1 homolog isoform X2 [Phalaenopsis equestris]|uniref:protein YIPF1 homolog isoform X2 n=1 Tax=Phalaenopsis equestris TaxID=78828 RepID=UPI0009E64FF9|nr:protein YIPF1 homolog isoform X2 [Phalaenopsis equestris]
MEEGYTSLPTSHSVGSVPAVVAEESRVPKTNLQIFPPGSSASGYQAPGTPYGEDVQSTSSWNGYFSISSYQPFFNVDTDMVFDRLVGALYPMDGFYTKVHSNPDLYGPVWISTTLVFMLSALGNCAAYLMNNGSKAEIAWNFDVNYVDWAASIIYCYVLAVPAAFYFLLRYFECNVGLIQLWCIWGYSLSIFIPTSLLLVIPLEILRWIIILFTGSASAYFIALNLKPYTEGQHSLFLWVIGASVLQFVLAIFIKIFFFA